MQLATNIGLNIGGRAVIGTFGLFFFGNLYGGSFGIFLGSLIGAILSSRFTNFYPKFGKWNSRDWIVFWKSWIALGALFFLINSDVLVARYVLSPDDSGSYSAGAVLSRVAFFIPGAILVVLFPRFNSGADRNYLKITFALSLFIGFLVSISAFLFRNQIISILGGQKYISIIDLLWLFCAQGSIFALIQVAIYQMTNLRDRIGVFIVMFAGFATLILGNAIGNTVSEVIELSVLVGVITCVFSAIRIGIYEVKSSKNTN